MSVTDADGQQANGNLVIAIADDGPIAADDTDEVVEGGSTMGNVLTGVGGDLDAAGADTPGADDLPASAVVGVEAGDTNANVINGDGVGGTGVVGAYGTLVLNADGSYTYTADPDTSPPADAVDVFTYTIIDNDGTASNATITIDVIDDLDPTLDVPTTGEAGTSVDEKGLPARTGEPEGSGEAADAAADSDDSEITSGTIAFTPGDTPATVTIDGLGLGGPVEITGRARRSRGVTAR